MCVHATASIREYKISISDKNTAKQFLVLNCIKTKTLQDSIASY